MPKLSEEVVKQKVFLNSLETCEYISGYETIQASSLTTPIDLMNTICTHFEKGIPDRAKK